MTTLTSDILDDKPLLKLLEAGLGVDAASRHLNVSPGAVLARVREFVQNGILVCRGEGEQVNWRAYGQWRSNQRTPESV